MSQKTCFVIIGYGIKTDFATGRDINLDKTYTNIIEPVFKELGFLCFRASDIQHSGMIDLPMFENILKADFVVADLTTLNPNVLYELGVRHAVRKNTTLVISDKELKNPFDLSHIVIDQYEHLGKAIDYDEVLRFQKVLRDKVVALMKTPGIDSPIYTVMPRLQMPTFTEDEIQEIKESKKSDESLSDLIMAAEKAKDDTDYKSAIKYLEKALEIGRDDFIIQRYALCTYKSKQPNAVDALFRAETILNELDPENTNDPETLGLAGAINKRLYEEVGEDEFFEKALDYYKRGFYVKNDYYNGINAAYLMVLKSVGVQDKFEAYANFGEAKVIRKKVIEICNAHIASKIWEERDDKQWILLTLAEAYFAEDDMVKVEKYVARVEEHLKGQFSMDTFLEQQTKLKDAVEQFKHNYLD